MATTETVRVVPGEEGAWVFIFGGMLEFGAYFLAYLSARRTDPELFARSQAALNQTFGVVNTMLLLGASLFVALAIRCIRRRDLSTSRLLLRAAIGCGLIFSVLKAVEYHQKWSHGLTFSTNDFFSYYYALTGLHWLHLTVALGGLSFMLRLTRRSMLTERHVTYCEVAGSFWHMVDMVWIVLFPLLYLVR